GQQYGFDEAVPGIALQEEHPEAHKDVPDVVSDRHGEPRPVVRPRGRRTAHSQHGTHASMIAF
ncbi:unnamed protein product, partial [Ixodes pacificus]